MTERVDVSERAVLFSRLARDALVQDRPVREKVEELALMMLGLSSNDAGLLFDAVIQGIQDQVSEVVLYLFLELVVQRKIEIERGAAPLRLQ
jgi:hypothetical protein